MKKFCLIDEFIEHLRVERGLSENTVEAYGRDLRSFFEYMGERVKAPEDVAVADIRDYLASLKSMGRASSTIARRLAALRVFYKFLLRRGEVSINPTSSLMGSKRGRRLPNVLSREELERLLEAPDNSSPAGLRDRAWLEMLYSCGLRVSELLRLTMNDINLHENFARILGKGDKERIVPFGEKAHQKLEEYLDKGRPRLAASGKPERVLFLNRRGAPLGRVGCWKLLKKYWRQAGGVRPISPHTLRHTFATHLVDNGADIRIVQELLGHSDVSTTEIYTHISRERLRREFLRFHPRGGGLKENGGK